MKKRFPKSKHRSFAALIGSIGILLSVMLFFLNCAAADNTAVNADEKKVTGAEENRNMERRIKPEYLTVNHRIRDVVAHPAFRGFGELLLPWEDNSRYYDVRLTQVGSLMPYHGYINPEVTVGALNHLIDETSLGKTVFYDFYTERQKQEDPAKKYTGLLFYRGKTGTPFAVICPGGGFSYIGSLHEGFPIAEEISKKGLNAFVIRYRVNEREATEDLAAAVAYIFNNSDSLGVSTKDYSLWGASAGARMVGNIALRGTSAYGGSRESKPATVVIAYTGQSTYSREFPPTFMTVSENDRIANPATVDARVQNLTNAGVEVEYRKYKTAGHGFGLGIGSDAEGWIEHAIEFWKKQLPKNRENL